MKKGNRSVTMGVLNIVAATATLCITSLCIVNAVRDFQK